MADFDNTEEVSDAEDTTIEDPSSESGSDDTPKTETAHETVERVVKEARAANKAEEDAGREDSQEPVKGQQQKKKDNREWDPDLQAPQRFNAAEKEDFGKLPKRAQRALSRMVKDHEARFSRDMQETHHAKAFAKEYSDVEEVIKPFVAEWARTYSLSRGQAIARLVGCNARLQNPDKNIRLQELATLCQGSQIDPSELQSYLSGGGQDQGNGHADLQNHPYVKHLEAQIGSLHQQFSPVVSSYQQAQQQQYTQLVGNITAELQAVQYEKDASGRFRYPNLHDDNFIESAKPLVSSLVGTVPGISYGDALRRAHDLLTGTSTFNAPQPTRLAQTPQQRAIGAATSVRGKSAGNGPAVNGLDVPDEILKQPGSRATVEYVINQLRRGN